MAEQPRLTPTRFLLETDRHAQYGLKYKAVIRLWREEDPASGWLLAIEQHRMGASFKPRLWLVTPTRAVLSLSNYRICKAATFKSPEAALAAWQTVRQQLTSLRAVAG